MYTIYHTEKGSFRHFKGEFQVLIVDDSRKIWCKSKLTYEDIKDLITSTTDIEVEVTLADLGLKNDCFYRIEYNGVVDIYVYRKNSLFKLVRQGPYNTATPRKFDAKVKKVKVLEFLEKHDPNIKYGVYYDKYKKD